MSASEVQSVVTVSRKRTKDQLPTGKFEGTAEGVEVVTADGGSSSVVEGELESGLDAGLLSVPAGVVEPPVFAAGALLCKCQPMSP